ncbi:MAG: PIN domain-containing protein [Spirochaetaceae bacterium]|nr:MAG: PIN domain-containing protein [Spirochaetaceae bacterium]
MTRIILDCSAAVALVLPDEKSAAVTQWLDGLPQDAEIAVPALWWYESTNVLLTAVRRGVMSAAEAREALSALRLLPRVTHEPPGPTTAAHLFHLGIGHTLTAYDAAYIALAELSGGTLLTLDRRLAAVAAAMQLAVICLQ